LKQWRMNDFTRKNVRLTSETYRTSSELEKCSQSFDSIICGSDEIWNIYSPFQDLDFNYFLAFTDEATSKISYGASFGQASQLGEHASQISKLLKNFSSISVRDENSLQLVRSCGSSAIKVLDPTFLIEYSKLISAPKTKRPYLLVYGILSPEEQAYTQKIAKDNHLDLIAIGYPCEVTHKNYLTLGLSDWLGYFSGASYVIADFYHGVVFSIIFRKPFSVFVRDHKSNKIGDLLRELNVDDSVLLSPASLYSQLPKLTMNLNLDYSKLQKMIQASKDYLFHALNLID